MKYKDYLVNIHNSTVCGYPGRGFDWNKFDFDGKTKYKFDGKSGKAPQAWVDNGFIDKGCEYLHVPYDYAEHGTIYRVRPNESMRAGKTYRGIKIHHQTAVKEKGQWYWRLFYEMPE